MKILKTLAAGAALLCAAGAAQATTISFGGPSSNNLGSTVSCSVFSAGCSDFDVTANASGFLNFGAQVSRRSSGIGVNGNPDLQPGQIDGFPAESQESLTFAFANQVSVTSIVLSKLNTGFDSDDEFDLFVDGGLFINNGTSSTITGPLVLSQFTIAAVGGDAGNDTNGFFGLGAKFDDFRVKSISYEEISAVPLPASSLLLLAGIGGLMAMRRKKTAA